MTGQIMLAALDWTNFIGLIGIPITFYAMKIFGKWNDNRKKANVAFAEQLVQQGRNEVEEKYALKSREAEDAKLKFDVSQLHDQFAHQTDTIVEKVVSLVENKANGNYAKLQTTVGKIDNSLEEFKESDAAWKKQHQESDDDQFNKVFDKLGIARG